MPKPTLTCFGGVGTVTGANFLLEIYSATGGKEKKVLIDCGLFQGFDESEKENENKFPYDPLSIDSLFVTHAHIDHIGRIPNLVEVGFKGVIFSTPETKEIATLMIRDLIHISGRDVGVLDKILGLWQTVGYHEVKDFSDFKVELFDAGHILGSAMYKFVFPSGLSAQAGKSILFSGDIGNSPSPLLGDVERVHGVSYILMDSVYGDRNHDNPEMRDAKFLEVLKDVVERKSTLLIPVFSLERTQIIIHELDRFFETGKLKNVPVFLDSPLAIQITEIYRKHIKNRGDFDFNKLKETAEVRDSIEIANIPGPKIILAGSGMSTAGRIVHHEERYLPDPNATILFVGYQAAGTLGRFIQDGMKEVDIKKKRIKVRAKILTINGFSAHAGSDQLVEFVAHSQKGIKKVFITMGEIKSSIFLAQRLKDELDVEAVIPERGKQYELDL